MVETWGGRCSCINICDDAFECTIGREVSKEAGVLPVTLQAGGISAFARLALNSWTLSTVPGKIMSLNEFCTVAKSSGCSGGASGCTTTSDADNFSTVVTYWLSVAVYLPAVLTVRLENHLRLSLFAASRSMLRPLRWLCGQLYGTFMAKRQLHIKFIRKVTSSYASASIADVGRRQLNDSAKLSDVRFYTSVSFGHLIRVCSEHARSRCRDSGEDTPCSVNHNSITPCPPFLPTTASATIATDYVAVPLKLTLPRCPTH